MKKLSEELLVHPGSRIKLAELDAGETHGVAKDSGERQLKKNLDRLSVLQYLLYAEARRSLLVVLQGIDAGGKDGTIRRVMSGLNPQGVSVTSFKAPDRPEKPHDYLCRVHNAVPQHRKIRIFNPTPSYYLLIIL